MMLKTLLSVVVMLSAKLSLFAETGLEPGALEKTVPPVSMVSAHMPMPVVTPKFEEYESKLLITGKWGDKPGEYKYRMWEGEFDWPQQFVVTDEEHVYILDQINNRVQHYNEEGKLLESIPIESYKLANKDEIASNHGLEFSSVSVERFEYIESRIYALINKRGGKERGNHVFRLNSGHFEEVTGEEELTRITKKISGPKDGNALKKVFAGSKKFQVITREAEFGQYETFAYDGMNIERMTQDGHGNVWLMGGRDVRKYSPDLRLLFKLSLGVESIIISKAGNIYLLGLYRSGQRDEQGMNVDDYDGLSVRKLSLKK